MTAGPAGLDTKGTYAARCALAYAPANCFHLGNRAATPGIMRAIGEQQNEQVAVGIDPERRSSPAGVPIAVRTEQRAGAGGLFAGWQCLPPQRAGADAAARRHGNLGELVNRFLFEYARATLQRTLVHHELRIARECARGGKQAGISGHATE